MPRRRYAGREGQAPEGLRSLRSLRPLPPSSASSLRDNLLPKGPSPCPCPGVDTPSGAWPPRPAPHDGNHPSGSKRGDGNLSDECRCGGRVLRINVYAAGCCCGGEIVLRPNHRMRRGQGATPAAFYLGLCRLRGILSPPAPHDCAAGGPFFCAATKIRVGCRPLLLCDGCGRADATTALQVGRSLSPRRLCCSDSQVWP